MDAELGRLIEKAAALKAAGAREVYLFGSVSKRKLRPMSAETAVAADRRYSGDS